MKKIIEDISNRIVRAYFTAKATLRELQGGFVPQEEQQQFTWPPVSGTATGYTAKGKTTIQWGTEGLLQSPAPTGAGFYTVTKFTQKPVTERIKLPNGTGITATDVMLIDGATWEITVRDDSGMTAPYVNGPITVVDAAGLLGAIGQQYVARVIDPSYDTASKQAGERILIADSLVLIDTQTGAAQTK